jgi:hypothetical protein
MANGPVNGNMTPILMGPDARAGFPEKIIIQPNNVTKEKTNNRFMVHPSFLMVYIIPHQHPMGYLRDDRNTVFPF